MEPLDDPVWHALCGPQSTLAEHRGAARRYRPEFTAFAALESGADTDAWDALSEIVGPGGVTLLVRDDPPLAGWECLGTFAVRQMVFDRDPGALATQGHTAVETLDASDVAAMRTLVQATEPGPWSTRTHELGAFVGIRVEGRLVAMAGQRMRLPDAIEVSAVCADPEHRRRGLALRRRRRGHRPYRRCRLPPVPARTRRQHRRDPCLRGPRVPNPHPAATRCVSRTGSVRARSVGRRPGENEHVFVILVACRPPSTSPRCSAAPSRASPRAWPGRASVSTTDPGSTSRGVARRVPTSSRPVSSWAWPGGRGAAGCGTGWSTIRGSPTGAVGTNRRSTRCSRRSTERSSAATDAASAARR